MRLRFGPCALIVTCGALASWACSLNPQPLPPETADASPDATVVFNGPDAAGGLDSSPPPNDAEVVDAPDDALDASDASDVSDDAESSDATMDARDE